MNTKLILLMQNQVSELVELTTKADGFMQYHQLSVETIYKVNLILEEALTNIIKYAYKDTLAHDIRVEMTLNEHELIIEFQDDGEEFDPISAPFRRPLIPFRKVRSVVWASISSNKWRMMSNTGVITAGIF